MTTSAETLTKGLRPASWEPASAAGFSDEPELVVSGLGRRRAGSDFAHGRRPSTVLNWWRFPFRIAHGPRACRLAEYAVTTVISYAAFSRRVKGERVYDWVLDAIDRHSFVDSRPRDRRFGPYGGYFEQQDCSRGERSISRRRAISRHQHRAHVSGTQSERANVDLSPLGVLEAEIVRFIFPQTSEESRGFTLKLTRGSM